MIYLPSFKKLICDLLIQARTSTVVLVSLCRFFWLNNKWFWVLFLNGVENYIQTFGKKILRLIKSKLESWFATNKLNKSFELLICWKLSLPTFGRNVEKKYIKLKQSGTETHTNKVNKIHSWTCGGLQIKHGNPLLVNKSQPKPDQVRPTAHVANSSLDWISEAQRNPVGHERPEREKQTLKKRFLFQKLSEGSALKLFHTFLTACLNQKL